MRVHVYLDFDEALDGKSSRREPTPAEKAEREGSCNESELNEETEHARERERERERKREEEEEEEEEPPGSRTYAECICQIKTPLECIELPVNMLVEGRTSRRTNERIGGARQSLSDEIGSARFPDSRALSRPDTNERAKRSSRAFCRSKMEERWLHSGGNNQAVEASRNHFAAIEQSSFSTDSLLLSRPLHSREGGSSPLSRCAI